MNSRANSDVFFSASHLLLDALVIVDRPLRRDELIGPPVPDYRLAAAIAESRQIRIIGSDHSAVLFHRLIPVTLVCRRRDGGPVKLRILSEEISEPVE